MTILINCSNLKVGGGLQVAHSFLYQIQSNSEHQFIVVLSDFLKYQINQSEFPENFKFFHYSIKPSALKALNGNDKFLSEIEDKYNPDVVFSVFGPTYWQPKARHVCGFAKPDYIYKDSPYFKQISFFQKLKLRAMEFFHMFDFRNNNECLITENPDVTRILSEKVTQKVHTVTNYYNQIFDNETSWVKNIKIDLPKETVKLLTISANYPHKNLAIIKKVIPALKQNFPEFQFKFILTIERKEFGISEDDSLNENIEFLGKVTINQCPNLYQQTDFLFLPTLLECFSASYCEAMFMEKPILTSDLPFAKGICGKAATYFNPINPIDIANKIVDLASNPKLQQELINFGKEQLETFDSSQIRAKKIFENFNRTRMKRIGILGRNGFLGNALSRYLTLFKEEYVEVEGERSLFSNADALDTFVKSCDVIVTFAGLNRLDDLNVVYQTNVNIAKELVASLERTNAKPHVIYSSTIHEDRDEFYGKSKKEARLLLSDWAKSNNALFTGLVIPNVFGSFGKPFYNSVVATFCHQLANNEAPKINVDGFLKLVYVDDVSKFIISKIEDGNFDEKIEVPFEAELKVSEVLQKLEHFKVTYQERGSIPEFESNLDLKLFNTFRNYINHTSHFPVKLTQHTDDRGSFVEIIRLEVGGQVSFSTTKPGITRGNHFHTRKIERFAVIKGKALIQLRKIGTDEVLNFELNGDEPAYVDMPIWYTHNIKNIGDEVLYTNFWINEFFDPNDADTYFVEV